MMRRTGSIIGQYCSMPIRMEALSDLGGETISSSLLGVTVMFAGLWKGVSHMRLKWLLQHAASCGT